MDVSSSEFVFEVSDDGFEKNDAMEHWDMMLPLFDEHKKMRQYLYLLQYIIIYL